MWPVKSFLPCPNLLFISHSEFDSSDLFLCYWLIWLLQVWPSVILIQTGPTTCILRLDACLDIPRNSPTQSYANHWEITTVLAAQVQDKWKNLSLSCIPTRNGESSCLLPCPVYFSTCNHQTLSILLLKLYLQSFPSPPPPQPVSDTRPHDHCLAHKGAWAHEARKEVHQGVEEDLNIYSWLLAYFYLCEDLHNIKLTINLLKMYNLVALNTFTILYNYHLHLVPRLTFIFMSYFQGLLFVHILMHVTYEYNCIVIICKWSYTYLEYVVKISLLRRVHDQKYRHMWSPNSSLRWQLREYFLKCL